MTPDKRFDPPAPDLTAQKRLREAFEALESGTADHAQARLIVRFLRSITSFDADTSIGAWIKDTGSAAGYEIACVEYQAKRWVFSQILPYLSNPDGRDGPVG